MDELAMTQGVIPVRHSSLPGVVKLPKRYEKAALGSPRTARHRKVSVCAGPLNMSETLSGRLEDLMTAVTWVKQELILLRQHDILLKRQFFNIHDSIQSLQLKNNSLTPSSPATLNGGISNGEVTNPLSLVTYFTTCSTPTSPTRRRPPSLISSTVEYSFETIYVRRPSSSVSVLNNITSGDTDSEEDDSFDDNFYRPRSSSMRTSRDLAASARRRGSKELI
ncbi:unnamed protein product [Lymnaea stagnalis]|uniref:Uncharacterized protein n=1 Tax=Lymnaea stagnalis TaxID=6523 RepID=A0AAV2HQA7_LYMST